MSVAANATVPVILPNPYTPLAFLPPNVAELFEVSGYVIVAGLSAFVWDWFMALPDEYRFLRTSRFSVANAVYLLSRLGTLAYCTTATIFQCGNVAHCQRFIYVITSCYILTMPATSLLFFFRVRAIWANSTIITVFFGVLWLGTLGTAILIPLAVDGAHIGTTERCIDTAVRSFASAPIALNAIYKTLVFIAISVRIVVFTGVGDTWRARFRSFASGDGLPRLSRSLLQSGQLYYFATIGISTSMAVLLITPSIPPIYPAMLSVPNIAVENAMACRVFRDIKLGFIKDNAGTFSGTTSGPASRLRFSANQDIALRTTRGGRINVEITKTTNTGDVTQSMEDFAYDKPTEGFHAV